MGIQIFARSKITWTLQIDLKSIKERKQFLIRPSLQEKILTLSLSKLPDLRKLSFTKKMYNGKIVGSKQNKKVIGSVIELLPEDIVTVLSHSTWLVTSFEESFGFVLRKDDIKNK